MLEIDVGLIYNIDATTKEEIRDVGAIWITDTEGVSRVVEPQAVYESYGVGVGGSLTDEQLEVLWQKNQTFYLKATYGNTRAEFRPSYGYGDNVSMKLRSIIEYVDDWSYRKAWIDDSNKEYVVVHCNGKTMKYYYDVERYGSTHGNYMQNGRMYVNAGDFGKYFNLTYHAENIWEDAILFVITGEFSGTHSPLFDGVSLIVDTKMCYETSRGVFVDAVQLRQQKYEVGKAYRYHVKYSNKEGEYSLIKYYKGRVDEGIIASFGFSLFAGFAGGSKHIRQLI